MRIIKALNLHQSEKSPLSRPIFYSPMWASISILLFAIMSTKIEYDDALSNFGTLKIVEPSQNINNLLKLEEIMNTFLAMIPSSFHSICTLWIDRDVHETRPKPMVWPCKSWDSTPWYRKSHGYLSRSHSWSTQTSEKCEIMVLETLQPMKL